MVKRKSIDDIVRRRNLTHNALRRYGMYLLRYNDRDIAAILLGIIPTTDHMVFYSAELEGILLYYKYHPFVMFKPDDLMYRVHRLSSVATSMSFICSSSSLPEIDMEKLDHMCSRLNYRMICTNSTSKKTLVDTGSCL